ncbi:MAG: pyridoxamine 5'-phosphate oxidase family protein [Candidatus Lokiarchaeota archaeon]|nr:pyridoxamine 5'-phosphate oxidase family protein [Candidatus Lokiarchaeota archaeon]
MTKYHMRRKEKEITEKDLLNTIIIEGKYVTISMCRKDEPYIVSLSYGYDQDKNCLYFHCANEGLKIDFIKTNPLVCATIIKDRGYKMNECDHAYQSIVMRGKLISIENLEEKKHGFDVLISHLEENTDRMKKKHLNNEKSYVNTCILRLDIEEISGKVNN